MNLCLETIRDLFLSFVKRVHATASLIIGAAIIVGAIIGASFLLAPVFAAILAAAGAVIGMLFAYPVLVKLLVIDNPKVNTEETVKALNTLHSEKEKLLVEFERLKGQRLRVEGVTPTAELCVLAVDTKITDYKDVYFDESGTEVDKSKPHVAKYIGCVEKEFKAKFGPDLTQLHIVEIGDDKLAIYGAIGGFRGFSNFRKKWHFREIFEKRFVPMKMADKFVVVEGDNRALNHSERQEQQILDRINQGVEFAHMQEGIGKIARRVIEVLLAPLGKHVVFESGEAPSGSAPLLSYLDGYRRRLAENLTGTEEKLKNVEASLKQLSNESLKVIQ